MNDNRIVGYIETPLRLSPGEYIVTGDWAASKLSYGNNYVIQHFRNEMPVGNWRISSVINFTTKTGPKIGLKVSSDNKFAYFQVGDIVADQDYNVDFYNVNIENGSDGNEVVVGSFLNDESARAIIYSGMSGLTMATMSYGKMYLPYTVQIKTVKGTKAARVIGKQGVVDQENPLEVRVDAKPKILLTELLNTMNPLRSFIVGVTKEYTNNYNTKAKALPSIHEPAVELKTGSIRILLAPNNEGQLSMYDQPSGLPYELLYKILSSANREETDAVIQIMSGNFINARKHLHNLLNLVRPFYKKGLLEVSLSGYEKVRANEATYRTIKTALNLIASREIEVTGQVYAIDTIRKWFRVIDVETEVDWKIVYTQKDDTEFDLSILTKGKIKVFATTFSPREAKRGIAEYVGHEFI